MLLIMVYYSIVLYVIYNRFLYTNIIYLYYTVYIYNVYKLKFTYKINKFKFIIFLKINILHFNTYLIIIINIILYI